MACNVDITTENNIVQVNNDNISVVTVGSPIRLDQSLFMNAVQVSSDYNPSILTENQILDVDTSGGPISVTISTEDIESATPTKQRVFIIGDGSGNAHTNNITIQLENGQHISGHDEIIISEVFNSVSILLNGTNGRVF